MAIKFNATSNNVIPFKVREEVVRFDVREETIYFRVETGSLIEIGGTWYDGDYTVIPSAHSDQTLETADKTMRDDLTVTEIPYQEVSNEHNGYTAVIAS